MMTIREDADSTLPPPNKDKNTHKPPPSSGKLETSHHMKKASVTAVIDLLWKSNLNIQTFITLE